MVLIFLFQAAGVYLLLKLRQQEVRQEIKSRIKAGVPESDLTVFKFDDQQQARLKWVDDHEFVLEGQMYDIVRLQNEGDITVFYCLHDTQETALFKKLNHLVANDLGNNQNRNNNKHQVTVNWFFAEAGSILPAFYPESEKVSTCYLLPSDDQFMRSESPPPNL